MITMNFAKYPYKYIHSKCHGVAFYSSHKLKFGDPFMVKYFVLENGKHPEPGNQIACSHCGLTFSSLDDGVLATEYKPPLTADYLGVEIDPSI